MVNVIEGESLEPHVLEYDVCLVGTNLYCQMSNGFEYFIRRRFKFVFCRNLETKYGDMEKLGTIVESSDPMYPTLFVLCFICVGYNFRPDVHSEYIRYEALEACLKLVNAKYKGKKIAATVMGSQIFDGNGNKERILDIFRQCLQDVDIDLYDYEQVNRHHPERSERKNFPRPKKTKEKEEKEQ